MLLNPEELPLSLQLFVNLSHTSPKRLGVISEANESSFELIAPSFSTDIASFSTGFLT